MKILRLLLLVATVEVSKVPHISIPCHKILQKFKSSVGNIKKYQNCQITM